MMFVEIERLNRRGANERPTISQELLRVDLIQRVLPHEENDWPAPCVKLILDNEETIVCQGTFADVMAAINEVL